MFLSIRTKRESFLTIRTKSVIKPYGNAINDKISNIFINQYRHIVQLHAILHVEGDDWIKLFFGASNKTKTIVGY